MWYNVYCDLEVRGDIVKLIELEKYRDKDNGRIDIDAFLKENSVSKITELRGASNKEKDWLKLDDTDVLIRTENLDSEGAIYTTYAELIFEELAKQVDIPCAHYDLVKYKCKNGVLSQNVINENESLVLMNDLLNCSKREHDIGDDQNIHVEDAINAFHTFYEEYNDFSKEDFKKMSNDFINMTIFDIYTMSTDRHAENMGIIFSVEGNKSSARLAPMFDNECSLMLDSPEEKIDKLLKNRMSLLSYVELENQKIYYTEDYENDTYENKDFNDLLDNMLKQNGLDTREMTDWQTTIYNISELGENQMNFIKKCDKNLNIDEALKNVEERIGVKLPEELCKFVSATFTARKLLINEELMLYKSDEERTNTKDNKGERANEDNYILG